MKRKKIIIIFIVLFVLLFIFILYKLLVPASSMELLRYANRKYNDAELIQYERENNKTIAIIKDKKMNFTYEVSCNIESAFCLDGSCISIKTRHYYDNYENKYVENIKNNAKEELEKFEKKYNCKIIWEDYQVNKIYVDFQYENLLNNALIELGNLIINYDKKNILNDYTIMSKLNNKLVGDEYRIKEKKYFSIKESDLERIIYALFREMKWERNINIKNVDDLKYVKTEILNFEKLPNMDTEKVNIYDYDEHKLIDVTVYYFEYKGEIWVVGDVDINYNSSLYITKL